MEKKKINIRNLVTSVTFLVVIFGLFVASIISPDALYSLTERRTLAQFPELSTETLLNGKFTGSFEGYTLDQFPERDSFRKLKAFYFMNIMNRGQVNKYYTADGYIDKLEYPKNQAAFDNAFAIFKDVNDKFLKGTDCNVYLSLIPDKNYFMAAQNGYLSFDYDKITEEVKTNMPYATYIDIYNTLSLKNYYYTDQHWKQETLMPTVRALLAGMGKETNAEYDIVKVEKDFYGTYYGPSTFDKTSPDVIQYLTNDTIKNCKVTSYDSGMGKKTSVYTLADLEGNDMYDVYLGGPDALIVIENPNATTDAELVIFRDSFGSSISPLLIDAYAKITLVDFRYVNYNALNAFVKFENQDVLYLFSTLIMNNSLTFKK